MALCRLPTQGLCQGQRCYYLQLHEFGLQFMNKSGKNNARISKIQTKCKYSAVAASI